MAEITVDLDAIATAQIQNLKKGYATLQRKVERLERELAELRRNKKEVLEALGQIRSFASDLPRYDWE